MILFRNKSPIIVLTFLIMKNDKIYCLLHFLKCPSNYGVFDLATYKQIIINKLYFFLLFNQLFILILIFIKTKLKRSNIKRSPKVIYIRFLNHALIKILLKTKRVFIVISSCYLLYALYTMYFSKRYIYVKNIIYFNFIQ